MQIHTHTHTHTQHTHIRIYIHRQRHMFSDFCLHTMTFCMFLLLGGVGPPGNTGLTGEKGIDRI